jgi:hypothetical protein
MIRPPAIDAIYDHVKFTFTDFRGIDRGKLSKAAMATIRPSSIVSFKPVGYKNWPLSATE